MKIIFNAMDCGLGNNGGSQTIVKSANVLVDMGHDVSIIDTCKNMHTWNILKAKHILPKNKKPILYPKCDAIIGTGIKTFKSTAMYRESTVKLHWIRGWETWQMNSDKMIQLFKINQHKIKLLTNGAGIQKMLRKNDIQTDIQLAGMDIKSNMINLSHYNNTKNNNVVVLGGLVNTRHETKQTDYLFKIFNYLNATMDKEVILYTFGNEKTNFKSFNYFHISEPDTKIKNEMYNKIDFWISPSINEGFHIPPAEFMLNDNGGIVIGVDSPFSGTKQYLKNNLTGILCEDKWLSFADKIIEYDNKRKEMELMSTKAYNYIYDYVGSRHDNMIKLISIIERML